MQTTDMVPGEMPPQVFISSTMDDEMAPFRQQAVSTIQGVANLSPWAFEFTPASSEPVEEGFLRKVREAAIVIWLATQNTTPAVHAEIEAALAANRRLLVFRFFDGDGTPETMALLSRLMHRVKWTSITQNITFGEALRQSLCDEVARALQREAESAPENILNEQWRFSIARCIESWQSVQVPLEIASQMALDLTVGFHHLDASSSGVMVITGEVGIGKSLTLERLYQKALQAFRVNRSGPIPVCIRAQQDGATLEDAITEATSRLGNPRTQGVQVFVDGADEAGENRLKVVLQESRILCKAWPRTTFTLASRPLPLTTGCEETVTVPLLTDAQSAFLISRMAGHEFHPYILRSFSPPLREAVLRPLFAISYGLCIRRLRSHMPRSRGELLDALAEEAVGRASECVRTSKALRQLAELSIERGSRHIHASDVSEPDDLRRVCATGIVVRKDNIVDFPLVVLRDWFACESLLRGETSATTIAESPQRADRWRYPLVMALAKMDYNSASKVLVPLVTKHPAFAAQVVREALVNTTSIEEYSLPPALECGRQLREALATWLGAIGPLATAYGPLDDRDCLPPMAVDRQDRSLAISWYDGHEQLPDVTEMNLCLLSEINKRDWPGWHWSVIGRQPAWAWLHSLEMIAHDVTDGVKKKLFMPPGGPLKDEMYWAWILELTSRGGLWSEPIAIAEIEDKLQGLPQGRARLFPSPVVIDVAALRERLHELKGADAKYWPSPTCGRDEAQGSWAWSGYSDQQLLKKVIDVYQQALVGYQQMVDKWFEAFRDRMERAATLPACLTGVVIPSDNGTDFKPPSISFVLDPLPYGAANEVALQLGQEPLSHSPEHEQYNKLCRSRPESASWISAWLETSVLDIFIAQPATNLVYRWIERDLSKIGWMK